MRHYISFVVTSSTSMISSVQVLNWFLVNHVFRAPTFVSFMFISLLGSSSVTPKRFVESHLPRSMSGASTYSISSTFTGGDFSRANLAIFTGGDFSRASLVIFTGGDFSRASLVIFTGGDFSRASLVIFTGGDFSSG